MKRWLWGIAVAAASVAAAPGAVQAASHTCNTLGSDSIEIDGMIDDWRAVGHARVGGTSSNLSFDLRCAVHGSMLYLSLDIRDQKVRRGKGAQDSALIRLRAQGRWVELRALPGVGKIKPQRTWNRGRLPGWLSVEDSLQPRGWSVEAAIPLARIPGWSKALPFFEAKISVSDSDGGGARARSFDGRLFMQAGRAAYRTFLKTTGLSAQKIQLDKMIDIDGARGRERVIVGGKVLGVVTDRFAYMSLPVRSVSDVIGIKVVDLRGDGTHSFVAHYRQHGSGGSREVVGVWNFRSNGRFERVLAFEVNKTLGSNQLRCKWYFAPKGRHRKKAKRGRGLDIVVEALPAKGWDEDNYEAVPARDVRPILLPWEDQTSAVYWFEGWRSGGGAPKGR